MNIEDQASEQEEFARDIALKARKPELAKIGVCYECREAVKPNANFCDKDFRTTYERRTENAKGK